MDGAEHLGPDIELRPDVLTRVFTTLGDIFSVITEKMSPKARWGGGYGFVPVTSTL